MRALLAELVNTIAEQHESEKELIIQAEALNIVVTAILMRLDDNVRAQLKNEINEAFAVQVIAFLDHFGIADDDARVNPYGGAIAVGHPLASSGVRLMLNLARTFESQPEVRYGITTMCIGLGMGGTVIWENPNFKGAK